MAALQHLISLGRKIEHKLVVQSQQQSMQAGDIAAILEKAGLYADPSNAAAAQALAAKVSPLLNAAGVPENVSIKTSIVVDKNLNVSFTVDATTPDGRQHPSGMVLARLLKANFGNAIKNALVAGKASVAETITVNWVQF